MRLQESHENDRRFHEGDGPAWKAGRVQVEWHEELADIAREQIAHLDASGAATSRLQDVLHKWGFVSSEAAVPVESLDFDGTNSVEELQFRDNPDVVAISRDLSELPEVAAAAPVPIFVPASNPRDEPLVGTSDTLTSGTDGFERQWYLFRCGVPDAWDLGATGKDVVIADIDFGVRVTHNDLKPRLELANAHNSFDGGTDVSAGSCDHGTAVCGLLAADANGDGMAGVAFGATLWPIQADFGTGTPLKGDHFASAISWVRRRDSHGRPKVINLEFQTKQLGNCEQGPAVHRAIREAIASGVVVCVAAGNGNKDAGITDYQTRIRNSGAIVVASTALDDSGADVRHPSSNYGPRVDIAAPGDSRHDITCGADDDDAYVNEFGGTSGAVAKVAGTVALMLQINPDLTPSDVREILITTGRSISTDKPIGVFLDAAAAVRVALHRRQALAISETVHKEAVSQPR
jgi:subtilisin family serine protease